MNREIEKQVKGFQTQDGAGVHLVRVLGSQTTRAFDPILMLDSFDSDNPDDYTAGFPMHPHRGIETISYVYHGGMVHRDSLGNEDAIGDGEVQWMCAGSGIYHEEKIPAAPRMLGVQLWLNLPAAEKMSAPTYHSIKNDAIEEIPFTGGYIRLLAGTYKGRDESTAHQGYKGEHLAMDYYDIHLYPHATIELNTEPDRSVMVFTLKGDALVADEIVEEKTAVKLSSGNTVSLQATDEAAQILFMSSKALDEPVAWHGPIVMNTDAELREAFEDMEKGTFLRQDMNYEE